MLGLIILFFMYYYLIKTCLIFNLFFFLLDQSQVKLKCILLDVVHVTHGCDSNPNPPNDANTIEAQCGKENRPIRKASKPAYLEDYVQ